MTEANQIFLKKKFLQNLLNEVEEMKLSIKQNLSLIQEIYDSCNHRDENGNLSFQSCTDAADGGNFYICNECNKNIS